MSDFDRALEARFQAERDRAANIFRGACEWVSARNVTLDIVLDAMARHTKFGDEHGVLWAECPTCNDGDDCARKPLRTELPFGAPTCDCRECGKRIGVKL